MRRRRDSNRNGTVRQGQANVFTSRCYDKILRGTAKQIADKYDTMAGECMADNDTTTAQMYLQHAEHYIVLQSE